MLQKALYPSLPHSFFHSHGKESRILYSNFFWPKNLHGRLRYGAMYTCTQDFCTGIKVLCGVVYFKLTLAPPHVVDRTSQLVHPPNPAQCCGPDSQGTLCTASSCVWSRAGTDRLALGGGLMATLALGESLMVTVALGEGLMAIWYLL